MEEARRLARKKREWEQGSRDAAEDISELSEGEKAELAGTARSIPSRINSDMKMWTEEEHGKSKHLYIVLIRYGIMILVVMISKQSKRV